MKRKPKSADLTIRMSEADRRTIEAAAKEDHLPASTWLRQAALRQAAATREAKVRRARLAELAKRLPGLPAFDRDDS
ncbi:MAG: hypothetical protein JST92_15490 [Deltaproteobacteria bacterium]|nr:hypothetical protein [Deltaproteobacteria bacterium]